MSEYYRLAGAGGPVLESLTCALVRSEMTTPCHTLRASGKREPEEGSPKRDEAWDLESCGQGRMPDILAESPADQIKLSSRAVR